MYFSGMKSNQSAAQHLPDSTISKVFRRISLGRKLRFGGKVPSTGMQRD